MKIALFSLGLAVAIAAASAFPVLVSQLPYCVLMTTLHSQCLILSRLFFTWWLVLTFDLQEGSKPEAEVAKRQMVYVS